MSDYDAIVIGAGHNGLAAATILAKEGLRVLTLEKNAYVGGMAATIELFKGFKHDIGASMLFPTSERIVQDLEMEKFGLEFLDMPIMTVAISELDEKPLIMYADPAELTQHIMTSHGLDALQGVAGLFEFCSIAGQFLDRFNPLSPPQYLQSLIDGSSNDQVKDVLRTCLFGSAMDVINRFFPDPERHRAIRSMMAFMAVQSTYRGPFTPGSALCLACALATPPGGQLMKRIKGGMGMLPEGLRRSLQEKGGEVRLKTPVKKIVIENGKAVGVELQDGEKITASVVLSNLDARSTFIRLAGEDSLPPEFARQVKGIDNRAAYLQILVTLKELPEFIGDHAYMNEDGMRGGFSIFQSPEHFEECWDSCKWGHVPKDPTLGIQIPSYWDDTAAPSGYHSATIFSMYFPDAAPRDQHGRLKDEMADKVIDKLNRYAPNFRDSIIDKAVFAPMHYEAMFGCTGGDFTHGLVHPEQMLSFRPVVGWTEYKTPVEKLYLCGSACHPGPGVTFIPGYNSAHEVLKDWKD
ncbi:MAG: NAD(P)/FAD-dependent oxidoreductase [Deltaproteobacteria bacterium]|nr:NAD(P)/FAD-dependent oxidoreductase [Deltaproteobacteria bacterium]